MNFHKLIYRNPPILAFLIFFLLVTIFNPKKWWATLINCIILIGLQILAFPRIGNHSTILLFISLTVWSLFFLKYFRINLNIKPDFISYSFRIITITIYFYTGFHKLNTDFFNSCVSCVNEINENTISGILNTNFKITDDISRFFQWSTIFIECVLPFGLLHHKTRKYTALLLLFFHFYLAFSFFADFCAAALFLLIGCIIDFKKEVSPKTIYFLKIYLIFIVIAVVGYCLLPFTNIEKIKYRFVQGITFNIGLFLFAFHYFKKTSSKKLQFQKKYILPLASMSFLISIWTLKTYIGLGNAGNLTMFSNLVTEKSMNNHWLIDTKKTKLFDFEEDNVYIISIQNQSIKKYYNGYILPATEFRFLVNYWSRKYSKPIPCTLIYKGKKQHFEDIRKSPFTETKWWYKYLFFRKIQTSSPNKCRW